jgi:hypothetical protein
LEINAMRNSSYLCNLGPGRTRECKPIQCPKSHLREIVITHRAIFGGHIYTCCEFPDCFIGISRRAENFGQQDACVAIIQILEREGVKGTFVIRFQDMTTLPIDVFPNGFLVWTVTPVALDVIQARVQSAHVSIAHDGHPNVSYLLKLENRYGTKTTLPTSLPVFLSEHEALNCRAQRLQKTQEMMAKQNNSIGFYNHV